MVLSETQYTNFTYIMHISTKVNAEFLMVGNGVLFWVIVLAIAAIETSSLDVHHKGDENCLLKENSIINTQGYAFRTKKHRHTSYKKV